MAITPLTPLTPLQIQSITNRDIFQPQENKTSRAGFSDVFKSVWDNTVSSERDLAQKQYLQSIGEIDDTHTVPIAASKAELSLNLMVSLRNKALEAYNELIRMNV